MSDPPPATPQFNSAAENKQNNDPSGESENRKDGGPNPGPPSAACRRGCCQDWRRWRSMKVSSHLCSNISYLAHVSLRTRMWNGSCLQAKRIHGNVNFCSSAKLVFHSILELHSLLADNLVYMITVTHYSQLGAQKNSSFSSHSWRR